MPRLYHEPEIPLAARRIVAALLLSAGIHAALIGLIGIRSAPQEKPGAPLRVRIMPNRPAPYAQARSGVTAKPEGAAKAADPLRPSLSGPSLPDSMLIAPAAILKSQEAPAAAPENPLSPGFSPVPVLNVTPLVDSTYYSARELDVLPRAMQPVLPAYPEAAARSRTQGWVLLTVRLDDAGQVNSIVVKESDPPDVFDQSAIAAFRHERFAPGMKDGHPVNSEVEIKVWFHLH